MILFTVKIQKLTLKIIELMVLYSHSSFFLEYFFFNEKLNES